MSFEYFEAESHASTYSKFRPGPPKNLIDRIIEYTSERVSKDLIPFKISKPFDLAVDVGCGSGQSTEVLAPYFKKVFGLDSSEKILDEARIKSRNANVVYSVCPGEKLDLEDGSADLITACQAAHWFDIPKFYSEVDRVLKPNGVLAMYGYGLPVPIFNDDKEIENIIEKYYKDVLGSFTLPQSRQVYLEKYTPKDFNEIYFIEGGKMKREENFLLEIEGGINDVIGYVTSWSAFQNYAKQMGKDCSEMILKTFEEEFRNILKQHGNPDSEFKIRYNYFLLLGRKAS